MEKLDLKDRKILYQLDLDSRQSFRSIGRKVGLSKDIVTSRIKKLQEMGIITCFWTAIDTFKLGYQVFRVYINFQDITSDKKIEIINYFINCKNVWAVISTKGEVDFGVLFWVNDVNSFYHFWNKTMSKYGRFFGKMTISTLNHVTAYKKSFLLTENFISSETEFYHLGSIGKIFKIDAVDHKILNEIAVNARIPLIKLASKLGCKTQSLNNRIRNLIKKEIILAFRVAIDISKLGLQNFGITIHLKDYSKRKAILDYLIKNPYLEYVDDNIGWSDLQFEVVVKNVEELIQIMDDLNTRFEGAIRKQSFEIVTKRHKERWLPEIEF